VPRILHLLRAKPCTAAGRAIKEILRDALRRLSNKNLSLAARCRTKASQRQAAWHGQAAIHRRSRAEGSDDILPAVVTDAQGQADHSAAWLIFWEMSTCFVRSVGFIPLHWLPRLSLSGYACVLVLALALLRLYLIGTIARPWW
jgi:hypothetical protein